MQSTMRAGLAAVAWSVAAAASAASGERGSALRLAPQLLSQPSEDARVRQAADRLRQELLPAPGPALPPDEEVQALEREVSLLREAARQDQATIARWREQARGQRRVMLWLGALCAVLLAVLALAWRRRVPPAVPQPAPASAGPLGDDPYPTVPPEVERAISAGLTRSSGAWPRRDGAALRLDVDLREASHDTGAPRR